MDQAITQWINASAGSSHLVDSIMIAATQYGVPLLVLAIVLQWWSRRERLHVRHACAAAGLSFVIGLGLNQIILLFVHRIRPYDAGVSHLIVSRSSDWSFPSDHATASFAIAAAFFLHGMFRRGIALLATALLVCVSRIYVGTHYGSDILGGAVTGIIAAGTVRAFYREGSLADRFITGIL
jgi:undecaprenyl-diphosphatase